MKTEALKEAYTSAQAEIVLFEDVDIVTASQSNGEVSSDTSGNGWTGW